jgi:hypothetical protein
MAGGRGRGRGANPRWMEKKPGAPAAAAAPSSFAERSPQPPAPRAATADDQAPTSQTKVWWRELKDEDPISLEPLSALEYPPFELRARLDGKARAGEANRYFDGRMLGSYLVSTGCFLHPISRRELLREECEALDAYLLTHNLGTACVSHTFAHREDYTLTATPHNRVARLREEATGILAGLFANAATTSTRQRRPAVQRQSSRTPIQRVPAMPGMSSGGGGGGAATAGHGTGLVVIDADDVAQSTAINDEIQTAWPTLPATAPKTSWAVAAGASEPEPEAVEEPKEESEEEEEELPPLAKYQIHFFGVVRRMAVESYLWSMQEQHELRWLESPPDGLWTTGGEWAVAAFEDREAWREMGSRLGGGIRGLFSARIYVEQVADTDGDGDEAEADIANRQAQQQQQDSGAMRVFLRAGRTRKTKEALAARNAADEKRRKEAPAKAAAKAARAQRAAIRRKERAIASAERAKVRRAQEAVARAQRTEALAAQHAAMLERRREAREAAETTLRLKAEAKAERHAASVLRRKQRDRKETALKVGRWASICVATLVVGWCFNWLVEPRRRVIEVVAACSTGIAEQGLRGFGAVGCAEPLLIICGIAVLAGAWTLRVTLESLKGPSKEVLAARRHLEKQKKKKKQKDK